MIDGTYDTSRVTGFSLHVYVVAFRAYPIICDRMVNAEGKVVGE